MNRRNGDTLGRRRLEEMYRDGRLRDFAERPEHGWVREIRVALGMSSSQHAHRMGQSQSAVSQLAVIYYRS